MQTQCPICRQQVDADLLDFHRQTEEHVLEKIRQRYPAWQNNEDKILWYYRNFVLRRGL